MKKKEGFSFTICDNGDTSVGIWPLRVEVNLPDVDKREFRDQLNIGGNRELFRKDMIEHLAPWVSDMKPYVVLEDECGDCGKLLELKKNGSGYKKCKTKIHL